VAFDDTVPDSVRNPAADDDGGYDVDGAGSDVDPALDLVRTMSMSSDKDILKQLRDAMNPRQKQQTIIMLVQAFMYVEAGQHHPAPLQTNQPTKHTHTHKHLYLRSFVRD